ncbi:Crp/Fnr family transcriptional regulator [Pedobacter caeni]|uniref:cAMP-binding domain of CRP or a regulatory subunit of cAMP-dependent protein kinases n=1 Tax=Pedobacter caeni TaxID=288992 RepID=A0A1M4VZI2_9SPHI|nr:Crp/Fnr family transcriptional regulator [Pedobacter caeni]SHE74283.1 cAMP-binding domain of CRP or a regulatory subunit of cAMP-dependent protein kinases [Pedobacter caeni]
MNPFNILFEHLQSTIDLNVEQLALIGNKFKEKKVKKKGFLLGAGEVSKHMRFIASGCLRSYYMDENSQEHTLQFGIENWWVNDLYSYLTGSPSNQFLQAIEESTILQIHKDDLEILIGEVPGIERFFRLKIQSAYVTLQERMLDNMSLTAYDRYVDFRNKYRDIEQRVPQYMIASYLGITPEFLSNIRKNAPR